MKMMLNRKYILLLILLYVLVIVAALGQRSIQLRAEEVDTTSSTGGEEEVPLINAPFDHPALLYIATCGLAGEVWIDLMKQLLSPGQVLFDLTAGFGLAFIPLAKHLTKTGSAIAFERNETMLQYLNINVGNVGIWDRVLFLPDKPVIEEDGKVSIEEAERFQRSYTDLMQLIGQRCPHMVILREHNEYDQGLESIFQRLPTILNQCRPILYFDVHTKLTLDRVEMLFHTYPSEFQWYVQKLCCLPVDSILSSRVGLLAMPTELLRSSVRDYSDLFRQFQLLPFVNQHRFASMLRHACDHTPNSLTVNPTPQTDILKTTTTTTTAAYFGKVVVDLDMLVTPFSATSCVVDFLRSSPSFSAVWQQHHSLIVALYDDPQSTDDYLSIMSHQCQSWISNFFHVLAQHQQFIPDCPAVYSTFEKDILDMTSSCFDFSSERITFLYKLHSKRIEAWQQMQSPPPSATPDMASIDMTIRTLQQSHYYPYTEFQTLKTWFERLPFDNNYHRDHCAEPVFCDHSVEFMKLIRKWQFPPKTNMEAKAKYLQEMKTSPLNISRSHFVPTVRSCENAKYLVYEVASGANGLGSMFGLIATALRYAICHDRILVLNMLGQYSSLLKWRPNGCQGSTFECYFEPLTHCSVTKELLLSAHISATGEDFHHYPFRDYKVLVLRGMPSVGPCSVCFDGMPKDSPFFDGYYIASYSAPGDMTYKAFTNMNAYMSTVKLPWISHFMRYFVRPRPWLVEAMREIITSAMISPKSTDGHTLAKFPETFISMHVRHGMKIVEVDLVSPTRYMQFIRKKFPLIKDIFVSTETEFVIHELTRLYPEYRFHFLHYDRVEILNVRATKHDAHVNGTTTDYVSELLYSLANLYVAVEADGFVGTLSSSWCLTIQYLERTRGDGGLDYYSMDRGSAFSTCF